MGAPTKIAVFLAFTSITGILVIGCGGEGSDGAGGLRPFLDLPTPPAPPAPPAPPPPPPTRVSPAGVDSNIRVDIHQKNSVPSVSLQDQLTHVYTLPAIAGNTYDIEFATSPSGRTINFSVDLQVGTTLTALVSATDVTSPHTQSVTPAQDGVILIRVFDPFQLSTTLTTLTVVPQQKPFSTTSFGVVLHIAGDSFTGFNAQNDLATTGDKMAFATDVIASVNSILAGNGANITITLTEIREHTNAQAAAVDASLVSGGNTKFTLTNFSLWNGLGVPAADATSGNAMDVFFVHSTDAAADGNVGVCNCLLNPITGGTFVGNGANSHLLMRLFSSTGTPEPKGQIYETVAHEIGHFLTLLHPTESNFAYDDIPDTGEVPLSADTNMNSVLNAAEIAGQPGVRNLMFFLSDGSLLQNQLTAQQLNAMRGYLATKSH